MRTETNMRTLSQMNELLFTDNGGYFKHGILSKIASRTNVSEQTVANVLRQRNIALREDTKIEVLKAANIVCDELEETNRLLND